jgi:hypothetical protein
MALKFDLAIVVASMAIAALWIEHGHRGLSGGPS